MSSLDSETTEEEESVHSEELWDGDTGDMCQTARKIVIKLLARPYISDDAAKGSISDWDNLQLYKTDVERILSDLCMSLKESGRFHVAWIVPADADIAPEADLLKGCRSMSRDLTLLYVILAQKAAEYTIQKKSPKGWLILESELHEAFDDSRDSSVHANAKRADDSFRSAISEAVKQRFVLRQSSPSNGDVLYQISPIVPAITTADQLDAIMQQLSPVAEGTKPDSTQAMDDEDAVPEPHSSGSSGYQESPADSDDESEDLQTTIYDFISEQ